MATHSYPWPGSCVKLVPDAPCENPSHVVICQFPQAHCDPLIVLSSGTRRVKKLLTIAAVHMPVV